MPACRIAATRGNQRDDAEGEDDAEREHPAAAAQLQYISAYQSQVEHQDRSSRRVVIVKKRCSSDTATGLTRSIAKPALKQTTQQLADHLAIGRSLGAQLEPQNTGAIGHLGDAGHPAQLQRRLIGVTADDVDRPRPPGGQLVEPALCDDLALVEDRGGVARALDLVEQVRGEQHRAALGNERANQLAHLADSGRVKPVHRLVEDQQLRVGKQTAGDSQALAHAHRVGLDAIVGARGQPDPCKRTVDPTIRGTFSRRRMDGEVLTAAEVRMKSRLLDDRADPGQRVRGPAGQLAAEQAHLAGSRRREPEQQPDQRRLARAVGTKQAERAAARHLKVDIGESGARPKPLVHAERLGGESFWRFGHEERQQLEGLLGGGGVDEPPDRVLAAAA